MLPYFIGKLYQYLMAEELQQMMFFQRKTNWFYSVHNKRFWTDLIWKSQNWNYFSIPIFLPFWLPFFCCCGKGLESVNPLLTLWLGQCKYFRSPLFPCSEIWGQQDLNQQCPCCRRFTAHLPFVTFNPGETSIYTFSLPVHMHSLEIALHIH